MQNLRLKFIKFNCTKLAIFAIFASILFSLFIFLHIANASQVFDPTEIGVGARSLGMGRAFTAVANDSSSIFTNPAGLSLSKKINLMSMSGNLMAEVPYTVIGGSYPMLDGVVGAGFILVSVNGISEARLNGITPEITGSNGSYSNRTLAISYAKDLNRDISIFKDNKIGMTLKLVSQGFSGSSSFESGNGSGFDVDLGILSSISEDTKAGLTIKNLIPGNNFGNDELAMVICGGVSKSFSNYNLKTAFDIELNRSALFHAGLEWNPIKMLKLRAGFDQKPSAGSTITNIAAGLGITFNGFTFDYAYHTFAELSEGTTHFFSVGYSGEDSTKNLPQPEENIQQMIKPNQLPVTTPAPKQELKAPTVMPETKNSPSIKPTTKKSPSTTKKKIR